LFTVNNKVTNPEIQQLEEEVVAALSDEVELEVAQNEAHQNLLC